MGVVRLIVGLAPDPEAPGWGRVLVAPQPVGDLTWAEATHQSPRGPVRVRWDREGAKFLLTLDVPPNATAHVRVPARAGVAVRTLAAAGGAALPGLRGERAGGVEVFRVGSGRYVFASELELPASP